MELVKAQLILHPEVDQQRTGDSRRKANQINKKRTFVAFEVPINQKQVMTEHRLKFDWLLS
jgi:hypothetical protein